MKYWFCFLFSWLALALNATACTNEFAPVCGYWMHTPKTQSFRNECTMHERGALLRHKGSCADQPAKGPKPSEPSKAAK